MEGRGRNGPERREHFLIGIPFFPAGVERDVAALEHGGDGFLADAEAVAFFRADADVAVGHAFTCGCCSWKGGNAKTSPPVQRSRKQRDSEQEEQQDRARTSDTINPYPSGGCKYQERTR